MRRVRAIAAAGTLTALIGCGHVFVLSHVKSRDEMLSRASHVLIGVIENQEFACWPFFRVSLPGESIGVYPDAERHAGEARYWKVLRRRVRVEAVLRGIERRKFIDVYRSSGQEGHLVTGTRLMTASAQSFFSTSNMGTITSSRIGGAASSSLPAVPTPVCRSTMPTPRPRRRLHPRTIPTSRSKSASSPPCAPVTPPRSRSIFTSWG